MKQRFKKIIAAGAVIGILLGSVGVGANESRARVETVTMAVVGDIMMHQEQIDGGKTSGGYQFDYMFEAVKPYIEGADIAIGNLETTLAGREKGYTGYPAFNAPEQLAQALKNTGFDVITTANNHSLDRRYAGVSRTLAELDAVGLAHTGTSRTQAESQQVLIREVNGIKIAWMAYTYGTNGISPDQGKGYCVNYLNKDKMSKDIALAKKQGADLICVSMHFGEEYQREPNAKQKEWVDFLLANGVDVVLGSHPHVLQPMEKTKDGNFVIYSLGNFVSAQTSRYRDSSIVLNLTISKNFETGKTTVDGVDYTPIWTDLSRIGGKPHFRVLPVELAVNSYKSGSDTYISSRDYTRLIQSLGDTTSMYKRPAVMQTQIEVGGGTSMYPTLQVEGQTMVELRSMAQALGIEIIWDVETAETLLRHEQGELLIRSGSRYVYEGETIKEWPVATRIINGKTFVPLRNVAEGVGKNVGYEPVQKTIKIW
ncbi:MAG: CapA family protein [Cellulosilyticaceae bacterium]